MENCTGFVALVNGGDFVGTYCCVCGEKEIGHTAAKLEAAQLEALIINRVDCEANRAQCKCYIKPGQKYTKVDVGGSGKYMIVNNTGEIFGIKAYGVIHRGHKFGTLDTINEFDWRGYRGIRKQSLAA